MSVAVRGGIAAVTNSAPIAMTMNAATGRRAMARFSGESRFTMS